MTVKNFVVRFFTLLFLIASVWFFFSAMTTTYTTESFSTAIIESWQDWLLSISFLAVAIWLSLLEEESTEKKTWP